MDQNKRIIQRHSLEGLTHGWECFIVDKRSSADLSEWSQWLRKKGEKSVG